MNPGFTKFIKSWLITSFGMLVAVVLLRPHLQCAGAKEIFVAALLLGLLNAFLRPFMLLLALPLLIFTLGLFMIVINAGLLYFVKAMMSVFGLHFGIEGFGWAMLGSVIISMVSLPLNLLTGNTKATLKVPRQKPPPAKSDDDGPVIDI